MNTALEVHGFRRERSGGRAILALVMVAVAAIVGISWLAQVRLAEHTRHDLAANLAHARDAAHTALRTWRAEEEQAVTVWANSPAVQRLTVELLAAPRTHEALLAAPAQARLRRLFEPLRAVRPYHGFFIIAPDGTSLASTRDANTGTPNLLLAQPVVLQRLLAGETVTSRPQRSDVPLADQSGELLSGRPTMFVGAPVRDANGEVIAACVFRLDPAQEFAALLRLGAPGVAGEALAFDAHGHVLGRVQDGGRFSLHTDAADRAATAALRLDPGPTGPGHLLTTAAATRSQAAEIDVQGYRGIHGAEVVGAWRWDDAMGIGIVSQITTQAAFGALRTATRTIQALTLLASLLVASLGAWFHAARRRLQAAHGRLVDVIEFTEEAVITFDVTRHINLANPAAHTMFGLPALVGNRVDDLIDDAVRGAYIDCLDDFVASQRGALARAELGTLRGRAKDGREVSLEASLSKHRSDGETMVTAVVQDITERLAAQRALQDSECSLREVIENVPIAMLVVDGDGRVEMYNAAFRTLCGWTREELPRAEDFVGRLELPGPVPGQDTSAGVLDLAAQAGDERPRRARLECRDGRWRDVELRVARLDGQRLVVSINDITERLRESAERDAMNRQLFHLQKMESLGQMTGGIAHDFNNMLSAVLGYSKLARRVAERDGHDDIGGYIDAAIEGGERAAELVVKLLAFSRGHPAALEELRVEEVVEGAAGLLRAVLPSSIELTTEVADELPPIRADAVLLDQVLVNLGINARDAMAETGRIAVRAAFHRDWQGRCTSCFQDFGGDYVEIAVADDGGGIASEDLLRIFEPFFTTKEPGKGTGMGLAMTHGIVHDHGGHIVVESSPAGTAFRLALPPMGGAVED